MNPTEQQWKQGCQPEAKAPLCDNHSGFFCTGCRETGMAHCGYPDECGGMAPMRRPEQGCTRHPHGPKVP
jgi:hypothetical protein